MRTTTITAATLLAGALLTGCGTGTGTPRPTVTVTQTVTATPGVEDEEPDTEAAEDAPVGETRETKDVRIENTKWISDANGEKIYQITFEVTNSSSEKSDYIIDFELLDKKGDRVGESFGDVTALAPGQKTRGTADHYVSDDPGKDSGVTVKARVIRVDRLAAM